MTIYHEAAASARLDDCTQHESTGDCCLAHALARIAELEGRRCETCAKWSQAFVDGSTLGVCHWLTFLREPLGELFWEPNTATVYTPIGHGCPDGWRAKEQAE